MERELEVGGLLEYLGWSWLYPSSLQKAFRCAKSMPEKLAWKVDVVVEVVPDSTPIVSSSLHPSPPALSPLVAQVVSSLAPFSRSMLLGDRNAPESPTISRALVLPDHPSP